MPKQTKLIPASSPKTRQVDKKLSAEINKIIEQTEGQNEALGKIIRSGKQKNSNQINTEVL